MAALKEGDVAPDFQLLLDNGKEISLSNLQGRNVLLFFFPKALTPG